MENSKIKKKRNRKKRNLTLNTSDGMDAFGRTPEEPVMDIW